MNTTAPSPIAYLNESRKALEAGDFKAALAACLEAFLTAPENLTIQKELVQLLGSTKGYQLPTAISNYLARSAHRNKLDIQALATIAANRAENDPSFAHVIETLASTPPGQLHILSEKAVFDAVLKDELLLLVLNSATAISPAIEALIKQLRRHALAARLNSGGSTEALWQFYPETLAAIANQCFHTEYVFDINSDEEANVTSLQKRVSAASNQLDASDCVALAMYKPLLAVLSQVSGLAVIEQSAAPANWPAWAFPVWVEQVQNPYLETELRSHLPKYTSIAQGLSSEIQHQYESFPYPRWQTIDIADQAISLKAMLGQHLPHFHIDKLTDAPVSTLFAGCGTGKQVVQMAQSIEMANIVAVDLSTPSLAHAKRKAIEHGLRDIQFGQADILKVKDIEDRFDFIVCTGVLHHMQDPALALKALTKVAKPNAVFFLALYSERARKHVLAARHHIETNDIPDTLQGIRKFRRDIHALSNDHVLKHISGSREFYSASGLHDLAFNRHELRFTPLQLEALLADCGLEFAGFNIARPDHKKLYSNRFPDDATMTNLQNWDQLEEEVPDLFRKMMQFWCIKSDN